MSQEVVITGTAEDIVALAWPIWRRVAFAAATCTALVELQSRGVYGSVLTPADVLLDENLPSGYAQVTRLAEGETLEPTLFPDVRIAVASLFA